MLNTAECLLKVMFMYLYHINLSGASCHTLYFIHGLNISRGGLLSKLNICIDKNVEILITLKIYIFSAFTIITHAGRKKKTKMHEEKKIYIMWQLAPPWLYVNAIFFIYSSFCPNVCHCGFIIFTHYSTYNRENRHLTLNTLRSKYVRSFC